MPTGAKAREGRARLLDRFVYTAIGCMCAVRFMRELAMDNAGFCRFHRGWVEKLAPEIFRSLLGMKEQGASGSSELGARIDRFPKTRQEAGLDWWFDIRKGIDESLREFDRQGLPVIYLGRVTRIPPCDIVDQRRLERCQSFPASSASSSPCSSTITSRVISTPGMGSSQRRLRSTTFAYCRDSYHPARWRWPLNGQPSTRTISIVPGKQ
jgi:hypothetical protein